MTGFFEELREQRWDDHRYYHHNRINQSLHFVSSVAFVCMYVLFFTHFAAAALMGWLFAMTSRQVGHFFFEPKGYDEVNQASHAYKESVKVGYNLHRKVILYCVWGAATLLLIVEPTLFGLFERPQGTEQFLNHLAQLWFVVGAGALLFRTVHPFFLRDVKTGLVWITKILTDPFHDIMLYHRAPLQALRGEMYDPNGPQRHA